MADMDEFGSSSRSFTGNPADACLPDDFEEDWRYNEYTVDENGYSVRVNHIEDDEVSEESDNDNAKKKKSDVQLSAEALKLDVLSMTKKLSKTLKTAKSSRETEPKCIHLPAHDTRGVYLITFDGHHSKKSNQGSYGAILRSGEGNPVAAVAGGSKLCISPYYHALEGMSSGLDLAIEHNIEKVYFVCNSVKVCETLRECFINDDEGRRCPFHPSGPFDVICHPCLQRKLVKGEPFDLVSALVKDIVIKGRRYYRRIFGIINVHVKEWNKPADFLAKMVCIPGQIKKLAPSEFPKDLWAKVNEYGGRNPFIYY